jgi:hypothetical protein
MPFRRQVAHCLRHPMLGQQLMALGEEPTPDTKKGE